MAGGLHFYLTVMANAQMVCTLLCLSLCARFPPTNFSACICVFPKKSGVKEPAESTAHLLPWFLVSKEDHKQTKTNKMAVYFRPSRNRHLFSSAIVKPGPPAGHPPPAPKRALWGKNRFQGGLFPPTPTQSSGPPGWTYKGDDVYVFPLQPTEGKVVQQHMAPVSLCDSFAVAASRTGAPAVTSGVNMCPKNRISASVSKIFGKSE